MATPPPNLYPNFYIIHHLLPSFFLKSSLHSLLSRIPKFLVPLPALHCEFFSIIFLSSISSHPPNSYDNFRHGFPLGNMHILHLFFFNHSFTPQASVGTSPLLKSIYIEEISTGSMSGPFSQEETERNFFGPSPNVIVQG